jgi:hypothetical protein
LYIIGGDIILERENIYRNVYNGQIASLRLLRATTGVLVRDGVDPDSLDVSVVDMAFLDFCIVPMLVKNISLNVGIGAGSLCNEEDCFIAILNVTFV